MKKLVLALMALGSVVSLSAGVTQVAQAQSYDRYDPNDSRYGRSSDDNDRYRYRRYSGCHATIRATGIAYPVAALSRSSARKAWRREAELVYGRDFNWNDARSQNITCEPYKLTIRCTATARPCA